MSGTLILSGRFDGCRSEKGESQGGNLHGSEVTSAPGVRIGPLAKPTREGIFTGSMNIVQRRIGDITIIDLQGNIMFEDGDQELRSAIASVLEAGGRKVILNMGEVPYLDSAGLSELVRSFVAVNKRGGKMVLIDLTRKVQDLLTISKLLTIFEKFDSETAAIRSLETAAPPPA